MCKIYRKTNRIYIKIYYSCGMKNANTIDKKHTEMLNVFHQNKTVVIPQLKDDIENLKLYLKTLNISQIDEYMETKDKIKQKKKDIKIYCSQEK